jgi:multiple sugar transport system permease protein
MAEAPRTDVDLEVLRRRYAARSSARRHLARLATVGLTLFLLAPFLWLVYMSVKPDEDIFAFPPKLLFVPTVEHFVALWDGSFIRAFVNSTIVAVTTTAASMLVGVPAAYALSRASWSGRGRWTAFLILTARMAPPIAFTIPYFVVYRYVGLLDTRTGLFVIYLTTNVPLVIWVMRSFFDATPRSIEEAAWMDGATLWQGLIKVVLPTLGPGLAATAIFAFLFAWNDFFFALILTRTNAMTAPVAVVNFLDYEGWQWGKIAAGGVIVMTPVLIFSMLVRRFLIQGLAAGAVKG